MDEPSNISSGYGVGTERATAQPARASGLELCVGDVERIERIFATPLKGSYTWNYLDADQRIAKLYALGKQRNWDATVQIDWSTHLERSAWPQYGDTGGPWLGWAPYESMSKPERIEFAWHMLSWMISQFLHGEQGALLIASQLVSCAPTYDAKLYAASQTFDEARHVEVFSRYLRTRVGIMYPINEQLKVLLDKILGDERWDLKFVGMQLIVESLALAAFQVQREMSFDPLLRSIIDHITRDEARHVAFGVLYLEQFVKALSPAEIDARAQFAFEACRVMRDSIVPVDVFSHYGVDVAEGSRWFLEAGELDRFRNLLFARIMPNLRRLGLLPPSIEPSYQALGLLELAALPDDSEIDWAVMSA